MSSYNRVNGIHVAEDPFLLREILRKEFDFSGLIMSDWSGSYSSSDAIKAGLDLEMPGPSMVRGVCVERDLVGGKLRGPEVDECVLRVSGHGYNDLLQVLHVCRFSTLPRKPKMREYPLKRPRNPSTRLLFPT